MRSVDGTTGDQAGRSIRWAGWTLVGRPLQRVGSDWERRNSTRTDILDQVVPATDRLALQVVGVVLWQHNRDKGEDLRVDIVIVVDLGASDWSARLSRVFGKSETRTRWPPRPRPHPARTGRVEEDTEERDSPFARRLSSIFCLSSGEADFLNWTMTRTRSTPQHGSVETREI